MPSLHFFGGEKGGVGKSLLCQSAVNYHIDKGMEFELFDADLSYPDVKKKYGSIVPCKTGFFSEAQKHENAADPIYLSAEKTRVLVNLPPRVESSVESFFNKDGIFELARESQIDIYMWFICDGNIPSIELLVRSLKRFNNNLKHIIVKNHGFYCQWDDFDKYELLQDLVKKYDAYIIDFPEIFKDILTQLDRDSMPFCQALKDESYLTICNQSRLENFLDEIYREFERIQIF